MNKFIQFITCNKTTKTKKYQPTHLSHEESDQSIPVAFIDENSLISHDSPGLLTNCEVIGFSRGGHGPGKSECQDTYAIIPKLSPNSCYFGVFDGHGFFGREVSLFVNERLSNAFNKNAKKLDKLASRGYIVDFLRSTFKSTELKLSNSGINISHSGTCCICVFISRGVCYIANLGDSRAVLGRQLEAGRISAMDLSRDHKPSLEDEKQRILKMGGIVDTMYHQGAPVGPLRVWTHNREAGTAMTRSMGDHKGKKAGLIAEPEILQYDLRPTDKFVIVASDGLWDVMTSLEAVSYVERYITEGKPKSQVAKAMLREAGNRWAKLEEGELDPYCDDITILVAFLDHQDQSSSARTAINIHRRIPIL